MSDWTEQQHLDARVWCRGGGSKSRDFAAALDEIERLQKENVTLRKASYRIVDAYALRREAFIQGAIREMRDALGPHD